MFRCSGLSHRDTAPKEFVGCCPQQRGSAGPTRALGKQTLGTASQKSAKGLNEAEKMEEVESRVKQSNELKVS